MLNLIRADFYKAIHGKVLKVCFLMMTGWIFLCAYAQKATIGMREYLVGTEVSANYIVVQLSRQKSKLFIMN